LGNYIFGGLQTRDYTAVAVGCVAAALLAQLLDRTVQALEVGARKRNRWLTGFALTVLFSLAAFSVGSVAVDVLGGDDDVVVVGSKPFTEQYILAEVVGGLVERRTGTAPEQRPSLGSTVAFDALAAGELDLYVDYSGTIWSTIMHRNDVPSSRAAALEETTRFLEARHGIVVVATLGFENSYCLAMRQRQASRLGVTTLSDLARVASGLSVAGDYEFFQRSEWRSIVDRYGMDFEANRTMDPALMYEAAATESVDVIGAYSTDGRIESYDLVALEDDRGAIPPYDAMLLASRELAERHPELVAELRRLDGRIDAATMRRLNALVDQEGQSPRQAALELISGLR
jgi:osmoprotectant transport system permease protein